MKISTARFITSAKGLEDCPPSLKPEFAFIGRSNVGKSSLVNMLTRQRDLAKVSNKPGKTKLINFFSMDDRWILVDLPGYGYAKVAKSEQSSFNESVSAYLAGRDNLKLIFVLIDSRYEPMELDLEFLTWLKECKSPHALVFTKTDLVSGEKWQRHVDVYTETLQALDLVVPPMLACSSKESKGRGELLSFIEERLPKKGAHKKGKGVSLGWLSKGGI